MPTKSRDVFINCAFDEEFAEAFRALVFAVLASRFRVRCAREVDDGTETRLEKLYRIIGESRYGIHDLSATDLDDINNLPRFNMPLELGFFLAAKRYGGEDQRSKQCIILDTQPYRFQMFISDLSGMDITPHHGSPRRMVGVIRDWLVTVSRNKRIPSTAAILDSYDRFMLALPVIADKLGLDATRIIYPDYERLVIAWVDADHGRAAP